MKTRLLALLAAVIIFSSAGCSKGAPPGYQRNARFSNPRTLKVGDPVMMSGLRIGRVESIALDPTRAGTLVRMEIKRSVVVKTDSTATINSAASPGRSLIVLDSGSPGAPTAEPGTVIKTSEKPTSEN